MLTRRGLMLGLLGVGTAGAAAVEAAAHEDVYRGLDLSGPHDTIVDVNGRKVVVTRRRFSPRDIRAMFETIREGRARGVL